MLGGWQVNGILLMRSGLPFNVIRGGDNQVSPRLRPNLVGDPELPQDERTLDRYFDTTAFSAEGLGTNAPGNAGGMSFGGPAS